MMLETEGPLYSCSFHHEKEVISLSRHRTGKLERRTRSEDTWLIKNEESTFGAEEMHALNGPEPDLFKMI